MDATDAPGRIWPPCVCRLLAATAILSLAAACSQPRTTSDREIELTEDPGGEQPSGDSQAEKYRRALEDPENLLAKPSSPRVPEAVRDREGGRLHRAVSAAPSGFNFHVENTARVQRLQTYLHDSFARRDLENPDEFVPGLAYKITRSDDYTEYTIHLREGVYWHRPNVDLSKEKYDWLGERRELTAEDCVFSFNLLKNDHVRAGAAKNYFRNMERAVKVDRYTCKVIWNDKTYPSRSQTLGWYPLPKWLYTRTPDGDEIPEDSIGRRFNDHWASSHPVGLGPYQLAEYDPDERLVLRRFDEYWGVEPPIREIEFAFVPKASERLRRLESGKLDFAELSPKQYRNNILKAGDESPFRPGGLEYEVVDRLAYYYIGWNMDKPLFSDAKVRRAMTHSFDRRGIIEDELYGLGELQFGPFYREHEANNPNVEPLPFDLRKARSLLSEAGWKDHDGDDVREKSIDGETREFEFSILVYNKPSTRRYISAFQKDLEKVGVSMHPKPVSWPMMQKKMNEKEFDAFTGGWALGWTIDPYQIWHSSQADVPKGSNRVGFRNQRADEIIETLRETFDHQRRIELFREFHSIVHRSQPYTFFYAPKSVYAWRPAVENVQFRKFRPKTFSVPWYIDRNERRD